MRIGFDARMVSHPGIGSYIRNLLSAMFPIATGAEFTLYGEPEELDHFKNIRLEHYAAPVYGWAELFNSPFTKDKFDITHIPHFNAPFRRVANLVITVHDFIYLKFPRFSSFLKSIGVAPVIANSIKNAKSIIVVSENTRKDVIENFPYAKKKIRVIYEAADPVFRRIIDGEHKSAVRRKYSLPEGFILYVGSLRKHKNIGALIDAYSLLKSKGIKQRLLLVGRRGPIEKALMKKIASSDVLYLGEVPTDDLAVIYNLAAVFVLPSLYEGFGLPVLEAMASGVPVIASSVASLPEVVGEAGVLIDPRDTAQLAHKLQLVLTDVSLRQELIAKGLERAAGFSWDTAARQTWQLYKEVSG